MRRPASGLVMRSRLASAQHSVPPSSSSLAWVSSWLINVCWAAGSRNRIPRCPVRIPPRWLASMRKRVARCREPGLARSIVARSSNLGAPTTYVRPTQSPAPEQDSPVPSTDSPALVGEYAEKSSSVSRTRPGTFHPRHRRHPRCGVLRQPRRGRRRLRYQKRSRAGGRRAPVTAVAEQQPALTARTPDTADTPGAACCASPAGAAVASATKKGHVPVAVPGR